MTTPLWSLLAFAAWTVLLLAFTVGIYRWSRILTARAQIAQFKADASDGEGWYQRATRAHLNCIENLPVFGAIVMVLYAGGIGGPLVDWLSISVPVARVVQSSVHVSFVQTNRVVAVRFSFFTVQLLAFLALIAVIVWRAGFGG
jgi:uncharacterized MAPEG superfamily protein